MRYYGEWIKQEAFKRIGHLYPKVQVPKEQGGGEATVIAWIWARTVASPDPTAHGAYVPLVSSLILSSKSGRKAWVDIINDSCAKDGWRFEVKTGEISIASEKSKSLGTKAGKGKDFICFLTNSPIQRSYIQSEGKAGKLSRRLMAIVALGKNGRIYLSPCPSHEDISVSVNNTPEVNTACETFLSGSTPTRAMITGGVCSAYGLKTWGHLFTSRQLIALTTFSDLVTEAQARAETDSLAAGMMGDGVPLADGGSGAKAYGQAIGVYLAFLVDKLADLCNSLNRWEPVAQCPRQLFARQAIPMIWDYAEGNPLGDSSGSWSILLKNLMDCMQNDLFIMRREKSGFSNQFDAQSDNGLREIMLSTDPPYYDNISYADLSDFFYIWMRQSLKSTYPKLFRTMLVPKAEELVATPYRFEGSSPKARDFFENGMLNACRQLYIYAKNDVPVTIYYAYKQNDSDGDDEGGQQTASTGWETMLSAVVKAGFIITGTWPMRTECISRATSLGTNALASSIVLVCRKRPTNAPVSTRRDFVATLKRELRPALAELQRANIAPVDLAQSAIGPGISVYSRYTEVLEADGSPMSVRTALAIINQELDSYFTEQEGALDGESRFCIGLYTQQAFNSMKFGEADVLARAKNTSVERMAARGMLIAERGSVRLLTREELPAQLDMRNPALWLLTQQLTRTMDIGGVSSSATLLIEAGDALGEQAKALAYRLFTIATQKKWTQDAFAYNSLVVAWPDIQSKAAELRSQKPKQGKLFD